MRRRNRRRSTTSRWRKRRNCKTATGYSWAISCCASRCGRRSVAFAKEVQNEKCKTAGSISILHIALVPTLRVGTQARPLRGLRWLGPEPRRGAASLAFPKQERGNESRIHAHLSTLSADQ